MFKSEWLTSVALCGSHVGCCADKEQEWMASYLEMRKITELRWRYNVVVCSEIFGACQGRNFTWFSCLQASSRNLSSWPFLTRQSAACGGHHDRFGKTLNTSYPPWTLLINSSSSCLRGLIYSQYAYSSTLCSSIQRCDKTLIGRLWPVSAGKVAAASQCTKSHRDSAVFFLILIF